MVLKEGGLRDQARVTAIALGTGLRVRLCPGDDSLEEGEEMQEVRDEEEQVEEGGSQWGDSEVGSQEEEGKGDNISHATSSSEGLKEGEQTRLTDQPEAKVEGKREEEGEAASRGEERGGSGLLIDLKQFSGSAIWSEEKGMEREVTSLCDERSRRCGGAVRNQDGAEKDQGVSPGVKKPLGWILKTPGADQTRSRMLLASAVVVWEWLNEHGRWRPYSPAVCHHIEAVIRSDPRCGSVVLGQVDPRLSPYIIDLHSMHQFRQDTGTLRPVRRSFYDPTSAPGQGWLWEWENDTGSWTAYDTDVGIAIQAARDRQQPWLDLAPLGFCYLIDFETMTQINGQTQRCRRIQRRSDLAYPLVAGPLPKSHHAWGPASMPSHGGLLGVDVSGVGMGLRVSSSGNGSAYP
ncbi:unnamed protein product [Pleuronectes platessa]|uniref:E3 ubiquitin-protein ligase n=1 Tax=Pleuronectes platessa TaxID=8262 RepID=A0A9N7YC15_PLEPL|nr:unnamed protein product [Pleuronectes platessa]